MNKPNIIIRMGASKFVADVRGADGAFVTFDLNKLDKRGQHKFRVELVKAFRQAGETK